VKSLMVRLQDFPLAEIRLYDIDEARQNTIAPVVEKVIRDHSQSIKFTVTSDPEVAFSGAHFVFAQMRVGQYKMREQDEKIPLRHGVVGQETCGPGGLAYGLRTILPMVELIDLVDRYAHESLDRELLQPGGDRRGRRAPPAPERARAEHLRYAGGRDAQYGGDSGR
jgi:maltose-6'-phosphate glucosidase